MIKLTNAQINRSACQQIKPEASKKMPPPCVFKLSLGVSWFGKTKVKGGFLITHESHTHIHMHMHMITCQF